MEREWWNPAWGLRTTVAEKIDMTVCGEEERAAYQDTIPVRRNNDSLTADANKIIGLL